MDFQEGTSVRHRPCIFVENSKKQSPSNFWFRSSNGDELDPASIIPFNKFYEHKTHKCSDKEIKISFKTIRSKSLIYFYPWWPQMTSLMTLFKMTFAVKFTANKYKHLTLRFHGSVAQWIRRLPTEQEIVGSSPAWVKLFRSLYWWRTFSKSWMSSMTSGYYLVPTWVEN